MTYTITLYNGKAVIYDDDMQRIIHVIQNVWSIGLDVNGVTAIIDNGIVFRVKKYHVRDPPKWLKEYLVDYGSIIEIEE